MPFNFDPQNENITISLQCDDCPDFLTKKCSEDCPADILIEKVERYPDKIVHTTTILR